MNNQSIQFEKIVPEGKALGYWDGRACFTVGPLPGETADVTITRAKKRYAEGALEHITVASKHRRAPHEDHFMACSPWQAVDYPYQVELKRHMLEETFGRPELGLAIADMVAAPQPLGYRNKLEFGVMITDDGQAQLAFHERDHGDQLVAAPVGCVLGSAAMNAAALGLVERLNQLEVGPSVASIMIRQSITSGKLLAAIRLRTKRSADWRSLMAADLAGLRVYRPAASGEMMTAFEIGDVMLGETIGGLGMSYQYDNFFQTNVPMFETALTHILQAIPKGAHLIDLYGGVGAIGLAAASHAQTVLGIEIDPVATEQAQANAARLELSNYEAMAAPAERIEAKLLDGADCVMVDPPRSGLHNRVIDMLLEAKPARIVYLSCNPVTQARDIMSLQGIYQASAVTGFDFYPGTLHLESLVVLDRRDV